jgi:hypothetical protein
MDILTIIFLSGMPLNQRLIAITIAFGIVILLFGESYLLGAFLNRLRWLPRNLLWGFNLPIWAIYIALLLFFNMSLNPGLLDQHGPLEQMLLRQGLLGFFRGVFTVIAIVLAWMGTRLGKIKPPKEKPLPRLVWTRPIFVLAITLAGSLALGLLMGVLFGPSDGFNGLLTTVPVPLLGWPLEPALPVMLVGFMLPIALAAPWFGPMFWRIERLPVSRFAQVGASLIGAGSIVLGIAILLTP